MSDYQDIYSDLPSRVYEVWQQAKRAQSGESPDRSVTAMLMAAAAGLAMPFESLKDVGAGNREDWNNHPAFFAAKQSDYQHVLKECQAFFCKHVADCPSLGDSSILRCQSLQGIRDAVETGQGAKEWSGAEKTTRNALKVIRNALAHNNLFAFGASAGEIERLAFFSENRVGFGGNSTVDGWNVVIITVANFELLLDMWFDLLKNAGAYQVAAEVCAVPHTVQGR